MNELSPDVARVVMQGEFDVSDADRLTALFRPAQVADSVTVDMSDTTYIDSSVLVCLIRLKKQLLKRGAGMIHLIGVRPSVRRLFEICDLEGEFDISA